VTPKRSASRAVIASEAKQSRSRAMALDQLALDRCAAVRFAVTATATRIAVLLGCFGLLTACDDGKGRGAPPSSDAVRIEDKTPGAWMRRDDDRDPAVWLASKEAGRPAAPTDARVAQLKRALELADAYFLESERMVANRTAQLAEMLAADSMPEDYATILDELSAVVNAKFGKATYGELCQYYFSLRRSGAERPKALQILKERYGASDPRP
jgi:hypothetical protein